MSSTTCPSRLVRFVTCGTFLIAVLMGPAMAAVGEPIIRELYVPYEDLAAVLQAGGRRVFLSAAEYQQLLAAADRVTEEPAPHVITWLHADYDATVEQRRLRISGRLRFDVLVAGLHAVEISLGHVGVRSITLDGQAAAVGRDGGRTVLFVDGLGPHELQVEAVAPVKVTAARQAVQFQLPAAATGRMRLVVPGAIEMKSGGQVLAREFDESANVTRFELVPGRGVTTLALSLNNRLLKQQQVVMARNVLVDELTETYERLHITSSLRVLQGAAERFRFAIPDGFEVLSVATPTLSRYSQSVEEGRRILEVILQSPATDIVVLNVTAQRVAPPLCDWELPKFTPLEMAGTVSLLGLLVEEQLVTNRLEATGVIPIDNDVLTSTLPESVFGAEPGAPRIHPIAAYYAPRSDFRVTGAFKKSTGRVDVVSNLLLVVHDAGLEVQGGFALRPLAEEIFACSFSVAPGWEVLDVTYDDGQPLPFERYDSSDGDTRMRVTLPQVVAPGETYRVYFRARRVPTDWLDTWRSREITFPQFSVRDATRERGAIAVAVHDDLMARAGAVAGLIPLDAKKKAEFNLSDAGANLAFSYDARPFSATILVARLQPRTTADTYSFVKIGPGILKAHYEIIFDVENARTSELTFLLPASTPAEIGIRGLDGAEVKESSSTEEDGVRRWTVQLATPTRGTIRLEITFQDRLDTGAENVSVSVPVMRAENVAYQTGAVAVEGDAELAMSVTTDARKIDVGELIGADYRPGNRLLGAFGFIGEPHSVSVDVSRPATYGLPTAIVERAELMTSLAAHGISQSAARFHLRTKATFVEIELPANSTLWSIYVDGQPAKPQRDGERLLVSLPVGDESLLRNLQIVYETPVLQLGLRGSLSLPAPQLYLRADSDSEPVKLPLADLAWQLFLPANYQMTNSHGTVHPNLADPVTREQLATDREPAVIVLAKWLLMSPGILSVHATREAALPAPVTPAPVTADAEFGAVANEETFARGSETVVDSARSQPEGAPQMTPPATPPTGADTKYLPGKKTTGRAWILEGLRSLKIELTAAGDHVWFQSLGADPQLEVSMADRRRFHMLGWLVALLVLLAGLALWWRSSRAGSVYVLTVLAVSSLIPTVIGCDWNLLSLCNMAFYAGLVLLAVPIWRVCRRALAPRADAKFRGPSTAAVTTALVAMAFLAGRGEAQETQLGPLTIRLGESPKPLEIPPDVVIIPYDSGQELMQPKAERVILAYEKYLELWNRAYPDERLTTPLPPAAYALAGANWETTLDVEDELRFAGYVDVDVFTDEPVRIPLAFAGGIVTRAAIDGQPARLEILAPEDRPANGINAAAQDPQRSVPAKIATDLLVLHIHGKGRTRLTMEVGFPLARRGGWRIAKGAIPSAIASALRVVVPQPDTELRFEGLADRSSYETATPETTIATALSANGRFEIQWRPKVTSAAVDGALTAESEAVLDVQEDSVRLAWRVLLRFPREQRDRFALRVPADYLVERVEGDNIAGWNVNGETIDIRLLKAARDQQKALIHLSRKFAREFGAISEFSAPLVTVPEAMLHEGKLAIRRSPLLDVQTVLAEGLSRSDFNAVQLVSAVSVESPLGIRPYQAYRFVQTPFRLTLSAQPIAAGLSAEIQSVLRLAQDERRLESRIVLRAEGRPVHQLEIELPADFEVENVEAPNGFQWSTMPNEDRQRLSVLLGSGQIDEFAIVINGTLGARGAVAAVPLPQILVADASRQESMIVVQTDPGFDARTENLQGCQTVLLSRSFAWLVEQQRALARLAIHCPRGAFAGELRLVERAPQVGCQTVSNLRVTSRAFEETVLLDFTIRDAGIREVEFLLPATLRTARIEAPLIRTKTIEDAPQSKGMVRVRLQLQDAVIGQFRVLVQNDQLLTSSERSVPIPIVITGRTQQQFIALESAGRDEVVVVADRDLEPLTRQQRQWQLLAGILSDAITQAYLVTPGATAPQLVVRTEDRQAVETVGARIAFARTTLVVDASGAYRGLQTYQVDNRTEQFLDITLPDDARLWTARVAGESVKPIEGQAKRVRIPLVKTAEGDQDYPIELKYGGRFGSWGQLEQISFPFMSTTNVKVEESQVRLYLPEEYRWFDFGGSMTLAESEQELAAGYLKYRTSQLLSTIEQLGNSNPFTRARAAFNLKKLTTSPMSSSGIQEKFRSGSAMVDRELEANLRALERAKEELAMQEDTSQREQVFDNRDRLNKFFIEQDAGLARNTVIESGDNFARPEGNKPKGEFATEIQQDWIENNRLSLRGVQEKDRQRSRVLLETPRQEVSNEAAQAPFRFGARKQEQIETRTAAAAAAPSRRGQDMDKIQRYNELLDKELEESQQQLALQQQRSDESRLSGGLRGERVEGVPPADGPASGQFGGLGGNMMQGAAEPMGETGQAMTPPVDADGNVVPTDPMLLEGLASLDVQLPVRGLEYRFRTPRGDIQIHARAVARPVITRLARLAAVLGILAMLGLGYAVTQRYGVNRMIGRLPATLLIVIGLLFFLLQIVPVLAALAILVGVVQLVRLARKSTSRSTLV